MDNLISIIVPVYNVEEYLDECVQSLINQTYKNLEIILIDDGSTDSCPSKCDEWAEKDKRIKVIHKENGGLASARNAGLDIITGDWFFFIDSDDCIYKNCILTLVSQIEEDVDIVQCNYERGDNFSKLNEKINSICETLNQNQVLEEFLVFNKMTTIVCGKIYNTRRYKDFRFNETCYVLEDVEFLSKIVQNCDNYIVCEYVGYFYRVRPNSLTTQVLTKRKILGIINSHESCLKNTIDDAKLNDKVKKWYMSSMFNWIIRAKREKVKDKKEIFKIIRKTLRKNYKVLFGCKLKLKIKIYLLFFSLI